MRQEEGQFSSINKLSLEEMKQKITEIEDRESLSKNALRKLRSLKKKVEVEEGTADNVNTQKRKHDKIDNHGKDKKNKKIKNEELVNDTKKNINSPFKKEKEGSLKKSKTDEYDLSKSVTKELLFIDDRVGSNTFENKQEKQQIKQTKKELFIKNKVDIASPKSKTDNFNKKYEELKVTNSKNELSDEEVCIKNEINGKSKQIKNQSLKTDVTKNVPEKKHTKHKEIIKGKLSEFKKVDKKKLKCEISVNSNKAEGELEESDSEDGSYSKSNDISSEEGELEESDSEINDSEANSNSNNSNLSESDDNSLKNELIINDKVSPQISQNQKKKRFEKISSGKEEGELEESKSDNELNAPSNLEAEYKLKQKENRNRVNENTPKKLRFVLFLGNLAYE